MKKLALIALLALMVAPAFAADVYTDSDDSTVTLTIYKYCECSLGGDITLKNGSNTVGVDPVGGGNATTVTGFTTFTANANFVFTANLYFAWDTTAGTDTADINVTATFNTTSAVLNGLTKVSSIPNGYYAGNVDVSVTFDLDTLADTYRGTLYLLVGDSTHFAPPAAVVF